MKVFLGGTCNNSTWRNDLIQFLEVDYFNPVVDDWTPECQSAELQERETCDFCLYCITPKMTGVYSIAEVVDDSNKRPEKTIFIILEKDDTSKKKFNAAQLRSLEAVAELIESNGSVVFDNLKDAANYINQNGEENEI